MSRQKDQRCGVRSGGALTRRWFVLAASAFVVPFSLGGCGWIFGPPFAPGTYSGEIPCTMDVVDPSGNTGADEFTSAITLTIDADGNFSINGVEIVVGAEVVRSMPTADLAFEVTKVTSHWHVVTVEYAPRPTLPGITIEGELVETYGWHAGSVLVAAQADLLVTDVSGTATIAVDCEGALTAQ